VLPIVVIVAIGIGSTALMAGMVLALMKSMKILSGSLVKFQQEVEPLLKDVRKGTEQSQAVLERISDRQLSRRPGGRLRR
jgi:hypothetical protein